MKLFNILLSDVHHVERLVDLLCECQIELIEEHSGLEGYNKVRYYHTFNLDKMMFYIKK